MSNANLENKLTHIKSTTLKAPFSSCRTRTTHIRAPFAWVGGKSRLAKEIISIMPEHKSYIEVFGGALSVFYQKDPSKIEIVNDINGDLINLHRIIKTRPQSLALELNSILKSRELFYLIKQGRLKPRNDIQRAAMYYYLIVMSFGSKKQHFAMSKTRAAKDIYKGFNAYSKRLKHAIIENMSFDKLISSYDNKDVLFYLDPPYVGTESYYTMPKGFNINEHEKLCEILKNIKSKFILSYNDCKVVRDLYKDFNIKEIGVKYSLNGKVRDKVSSELIITNY